MKLYRSFKGSTLLYSLLKAKEGKVVKLLDDNFGVIETGNQSWDLNTGPTNYGKHLSRSAFKRPYPFKILALVPPHSGLVGRKIQNIKVQI